MPKDLPTTIVMTMICNTPCRLLQKWGGLAQHNLAAHLEDKAKAKDIAKAKYKDNDDDEGPHVCACRRGVA